MSLDYSCFRPQYAPKSIDYSGVEKIVPEFPQLLKGELTEISSDRRKEIHSLLADIDNNYKGLESKISWDIHIALKHLNEANSLDKSNK